MKAIATFVVAFAMLACDPPKSKSDAPAPSPSTACTSFGQSCEFSPGKLGTCVQKDNCVKNCFVCQSQH